MRGVCLCLAVALLGATQSYVYIPDNVMPAFWQTLDSTRGESVHDRVQAFEQNVILPNLGFYANGEFSDDFYQGTLAIYLRQADAGEPALRAIGDRIARDLPVELVTLLNALPGLTLDRVQIAILPSFGHFNAQTHDVPGGIGVFFAPDGILRDDGPDADVDVDIAHEFFHIYQYQTHPGYDTSDLMVWQAVWGEGSAAYASQQLAAGATRAQALGASVADLTSAQTSAAACFVLDRWQSKNRDDIDDLIDGGAHLPGLPPRVGYAIGYLAAQDFAKHHTIAQIGSAPAAQVEPAMKATLRRLCGR